MVVYRGYKAWYLGLKRWKVEAPDGFRFDVKVAGIFDLMWRIRLWEEGSKILTWV